MDQADINNRFMYHPPTDPKADDHRAMRAQCHQLATQLNRFLPEGREKSLAITHLEEVMMWANAAIART